MTHQSVEEPYEKAHTGFPIRTACPSLPTGDVLGWPVGRDERSDHGVDAEKATQGERSKGRYLAVSVGAQKARREGENRQEEGGSGRRSDVQTND